MNQDAQIDKPPLSEPITGAPKNLREYYLQFCAKIGHGENPIFVNSSKDEIFHNMIGDEKPLLNLTDKSGKPKEWLSEDDLRTVIENQNTTEAQQSDEVLFDMFSFINGGKKPTLGELGINYWEGIIPENSDHSAELLDKVRKIFQFIDKNPKTELSEMLPDVVGLSKNKIQKFETNSNGKKSIINLFGDSCYSRGMLFVWHNYRNTRSAVHGMSPFKSDGDVQVNNINDVQVGYQTDEGPRIVRLNTFVFLLARHGISESITESTAVDQVYMSVQEYVEKVFSKTPDEMRANHEMENDNFIILNKLEGFEAVQQKILKSILDKMIDQAEKGYLDNVLKSINELH